MRTRRGKLSAEHPALAHHFDSLDQQHEAANIGMWAFLGTEVMFFGGLFTGYTVYRSLYPQAFEEASAHLNVLIGAVNTVVLLTSSLTMALGVRAAQTARRKALVNCLALTALLGTLFLVLKAVEYYIDYRDDLVPRLAFNPADWKNPSGPADPNFASHVELFLTFYYIMTGLHAIHLIVGITIMVILTVLAWRGRYTPDYYSPVEVGGLYWHFVDVVWIFLLPLLYLIGTHTSLF
jgi:cytochrome c oxidase subunit 3